MYQESLLYEPKNEPLAARLRPQSLDDIIGQEHLIGPGKILRHMIENDQITSMIFWGPPGVGKTTLAHVIALQTKAAFINFSAVTSGIKEIKEVMKKAEEKTAYGGKTIVFVDEIHRFNKAQQDAFLPFVEKGSITLIGATTENPSFEVNGALLSRCKVFVLKQLSSEQIVQLLRKAINDPRAFPDQQIEIRDEELNFIANFSNGDARMALSTLEMAVINAETVNGITRVSEESIEEITSKKSFLYDKKGEEHYNIISALHKSMRNSDPDAAVYWLARMLEAGEDPLYVARRVIRFASEDVGLADPRALQIAVAAYDACHYIGMPECTDALAEAVIYLSVAPKSNAIDVAYALARDDASHMLNEPVPLVIRNAETKLMKDLGYGKGYQYAHDSKDRLTNMQCLPDSLKDKEYYHPVNQGLENQIGEKLKQIKEWKKKHQDD